MVQTADPYVRAPNPDGAGSALCPACGGSETLSIYTISSIPVQICVLLDTRQEALDYPCGDLDLRFCETCGFIFNAKFDASLLDYASAAEESQHFSATFSRYARDLANDIARKCQLAGKTVLEIGCGRGDFLAEVVALADCAGVGIDPGLRAGRLDRPEAKRLDFISDYFSAEYANVDCDVVVCRHTLEHIGPVADFLTDVRATIADRDGAAVFFEIPDVGRVLREGAFWDIYYEHCSYFTPGAQARLFRQEGFAVTELRLVYDDQYIILFAELGGGEPVGKCGAEEELDTLRTWVGAFPEKVRAAKAQWHDFVTERAGAGQRIAIWGGGSKCVSFVTSLGIAADIATVVDVNPHKQGKYLPSVGTRIDGPQALVSDPPDIVIVMNPIYLDEIRTSLDDMGLAPEVIAV